MTTGLAELLCFYSTAVSLQILNPSLKHLVLATVLKTLHELLLTVAPVVVFPVKYLSYSNTD